MNRAQACRHLRNVISGGYGAPPDPAAAVWLADGLRRWAKDKASAEKLLCYLGLPTTHDRIEREARDYWLRMAASTLPGRHKSHRAELLATRLQRISRQGWPDIPDRCDRALALAFPSRRVNVLKPRQLETILGAID